MAKRDRGEQAGDIPSWSWVVAAGGLALVVGSAGFMLYQAIAGDDSPPDIVIDTQAVVARASGYLVPIRITNRGGSAAARLSVEGVLKEGDAVAETSEITIDYVPSHSNRRAGLIFSRDPAKFELEIRAKGYEEP